MPDPIYGEGYPGGLSLPSAVRVVVATDSGGTMSEINNILDVYVPRESVTITRNNEDGAAATAAIEMALPYGFYEDIPANRRIQIDDPDQINEFGGALGLFAGWVMQPVPSMQPGEERVVQVACVDDGILLQKPPKQISIQWPPGDGTPVVNTTVEASLTAGLDVVVTPGSTRNLYVGKKVFAANSDGSNRERIEIKTIDYVAGTFTADFLTDKVSTTTQVPLAMHYTGLVEVTPDDMTNLNVGSLIYCKKNHGNQNVGNEWTVIESVTGTTFFARFFAWKSHDWTVRSQWVIEGGISDKELIADGWQQHIDIMDPTTGDITTSLVSIPSLLDYCYNDEGYTVDKTGVDEINLSLPHGKWESSTPDAVLQWVIQQPHDPAVQPSYHMTFKQSALTSITTLVPMLRYFDKKDSGNIAAVLITDAQGVDASSTVARYSGYSYPEDGAVFANKQGVMGGNGAYGEWNDTDSQTNPLAVNYVGRVIENTIFVDTSLPTNEACVAKAAEIAENLQLSTRKRSATITTYAQLDPYILYQPMSLYFEAIREVGLSDPLEVVRVTLSFDQDGLAKYTLDLGKPKPMRVGLGILPSRLHKPTVTVNGMGKVGAVGSSVTRYSSEHTLLDADTDLHIIDTSDGPISKRLPIAHLNPGLPITVKVPQGSPDPVTVYAYQQDDILDTIDGAASIVIYPGESITLQSAGEYDTQGHGAPWHATSESGKSDNLLARSFIQGGSSFGTLAILGTLDEFGLKIITGMGASPAVDRAVFQANGIETDIYGYWDLNNNSTDDTATGLTAVGFRSAVGHGAVGTDIGGLDGLVGLFFLGSPSGSIEKVVGVLGGGQHVSPGGAHVDLVASVYGEHMVGDPGDIDVAASIFGEGQTAGAENYSGYFDGDVRVNGVLKVDADQVLTNRQAAIADADGTLSDLTTKFNTLLAELRTHGLIAT